MEKIDNILNKVISEVNIQLESKQYLENKNDELLVCEGSKLDSLALLSFISILEENTSEYDIDFMDIVMSGDENNVFNTVGSLKHFISKIK